MGLAGNGAIIMENSEQSEHAFWSLPCCQNWGRLEPEGISETFTDGETKDASQSDFYVGPSGASSRPLANISKSRDF